MHIYIYTHTCSSAGGREPHGAGRRLGLPADGGGLIADEIILCYVILYYVICYYMTLYYTLHYSIA